MFTLSGLDSELERLLPEFGYAVDVGANNGVVESHTLLLERKGWLVLCIEPNTFVFDELRRNRKLSINCACGDSTSMKDFAVMGKYPFQRGSGFHEDIMKERHGLDVAHTLKVKVRTLNEILSLSGFPRVDYVAVDVEGHELSVLNGFEIDIWRPWAITIEEWSDDDSALRFLETKGYRMVIEKKHPCAKQRDLAYIRCE